MRNEDAGPAAHPQLPGTQAAQMQRWQNSHTLSAASTVTFYLAGTLNLFPSAKFVTATLRQSKGAKESVSGRVGKGMFPWISQQSNVVKIVGNKQESWLGV